MIAAIALAISLCALGVSIALSLRVDDMDERCHRRHGVEVDRISRLPRR